MNGNVSACRVALAILACCDFFFLSIRVSVLRFFISLSVITCNWSVGFCGVVFLVIFGCVRSVMPLCKRHDLLVKLKRVAFNISGVRYKLELRAVLNKYTFLNYSLIERR